MDRAGSSLDIGGSLMMGTLMAIIVIGLLLILFLRRGIFPELRDFLAHGLDFLVHGLKTGFGWIK